jgi:hypothetical protein
LEYFADLKDWLTKNDFRGCPYTNTAAMLNTEAAVIREQVEGHKLFIRDFFVELAGQVADTRHAPQLGATLFLLYSGATAESQNVRAVWPVEAAVQAAGNLLTETDSGNLEEDISLL